MDILPVLNCVRNGDNILSDANLKALIELSHLFAMQFLNHKYHRDREKFTTMGYSFSDISIEAITPLFIENKKANKLALIRSFKEWQSPIATEEQAQFFLNKLVVNRVEKELVRIYKEADPFFAKIHDSLSYICEKRGYHKKLFFGSVFIFNNFSQFENKKFIPADEFENLPGDLFSGKLFEIVENLFDYLKTNTNYIAALPANVLIKKIKHGLILDLIDIHTVDDNPIDELLDVHKIVNDAREKTLNKLYTAYKYKLDSNELKIFESAITNIAVDLQNGGLTSGLYEYMKDRMENLTRQTFYKKYHSTLDYLQKILKKEILNGLNSR